MFRTLFSLLFLLSSNLCQSQQFGELSTFLSKQAPGSSVYFYDLNNRKELFEKGSAHPVKPASILKLLTSATALKELGPTYTFITELSSDRVPQRGSIDKLYLRGGGDPSFTIESLWMVVRRLRKLGIKSVGSVILDESLYAAHQKPKGQRAYNAGSSALAFNFNSLEIDICPADSVGAPAIISTDPFEVPVTIQGRVQTAPGSGSKAGVDEVRNDSKYGLHYHVYGSIGRNAACQVVYRSIENPVDFLGGTFLRLLSEESISVERGYARGATPPNAHLLFGWKSKALPEILIGLNHFSTNFTAEQILYALSGGGRWDRLAGAAKMVRYLNSLGVSASEVEIDDASGLSHANRISTRALGAVLRDMYFDPLNGAHFMASLPIAGLSGTLRERKFVGRSVIVRAKTGSINGVSSLAGYLQSQSGMNVAFVIISNGAGSRAGYHRVEEEIVRRFVSAIGGV